MNTGTASTPFGAVLYRSSSGVNRAPHRASGTGVFSSTRPERNVQAVVILVESSADAQRSAWISRR